MLLPFGRQRRPPDVALGKQDLCCLYMAMFVGIPDLRPVFLWQEALVRWTHLRSLTTTMHSR